MSDNYYEKLGQLILGSRLRKLSERLMLEMGNIYRSRNIDFEPGWFHIMFLLSENEKMSITQISEMLQVSHPSVIQVVGVLEKKDIVKISVDPLDKRKRMIELSDYGIRLLELIKPVWNEIDQMMITFLSEGDHSANILKAITEIENNLDEKPLTERMAGS
ncbi:MAG: MarR family winged helix-turn-helix transcriptional regulator [Bacteroidota bacterium]|nr:MarR family winged helix-turn-helix transcriptional regulator [Bacteroidota bacterium]